MAIVFDPVCGATPKQLLVLNNSSIPVRYTVTGASRLVPLWQILRVFTETKR